MDYVTKLQCSLEWSTMTLLQSSSPTACLGFLRPSGALIKPEMSATHIADQNEFAPQIAVLESMISEEWQNGAHRHTLEWSRQQSEMAGERESSKYFS